MTGLEARLDRWLSRWLGWPIPAGVGWAHTLGALALAAAGVQLLTGVLLALYYCPSPELAWESVRFIQKSLPAGATIRGLHHWGASAMVALLGLHLARVFLFAAFKGERRWTWVTGCGLLAIVLALGFTGYLLPWDARGYFATQVAAEIAATAPIVGETARKLLLGGSGLGQFTLTRFYALHVAALPLALAAAIALHLFLVRRWGTTPPFAQDGDPVEYPTRFYPDHAWKDAAAGLALVTGLLVVAAAWPPELGVPALAAPPDFVPRPEWYFLPLFELLHFFPGKLTFVGAHVIPGLAFLALVLLPWIERGPDRTPGRRKLPLACGAAAAALTGVLFVMALAEPLPERIAPKAPPTPKPADAAPSSVDAGKQLFLELECATCHEAGSAPELAYIGSKVKRQWLLDYMLAPHRIRWAEGGVRPLGRMPNFNLTGKESEALVDYLMTKRDPKRFADRPPRPASSEALALGQRLIDEKKCLDCHVLGDRGKPSGPDLTRAGARLQPAYLFTLLTDPARTPPGNPMKELKLTTAEVDALAAYLSTLE
ncbi:MAG: cytochrome b N-terminal domain-containing protein [Candidatus Wallbacteria bacterium]|nr:cytochrome b N-terminal domain-containing protein [Candidatus Wallbacteria bacterium]